MKLKLSSLGILLMTASAIKLEQKYKSDALDELLEGSLFKKKH